MRKSLFLISMLLATNALAFDAAKAPRYPSPDMYRPNVDSIILRGNNSSGDISNMTVVTPSAPDGKPISDLIQNPIGDASNMLTKAPGVPNGQPLATWMSTPFFAAAASPNSAAAYGDVDSGRAAVTVISTDGSPATGQERYGAFFKYAGPGTGDPAVINSAFGVGAASIKKNWETTTVPGQSIGINITARGGYHGTDAGAALPQYGGYNPGGDTSSIIANSFVSSGYSQNAILEGMSYYGEGGAFSAGGNLHGINVQLGAMRMFNPDGTVANPGIGIALAAKAGALGYAIQANNAARPGSYEIVPSIWAGFAKYNFDDGVHAPYDAFRVDQDGSIVLGANDNTKKVIRQIPGGTLQILNNAGQVIVQIDDAANVYLGASGHIVINNKTVLGPQQGPINNSTGSGDVVATVNAMLWSMRAHGLIAAQ
ncbi:hypothetical protein [Methylobacterium fujisawaense]